MLQKIKNYFVAGLLVLAPLFLTLVIIGYLVRLMDGFIVNPVFQMLPAEIDQASKIFLTKVMIAILVFFFVCLVGLFIIGIADCRGCTTGVRCANGLSAKRTGSSVIW